MRTTFSLALTSCLSLAQASTLRPRSFDYGSEKLRGVNLGGWLLLEPWITPSIFENAGAAAVDEWTFSEILGKQEAKSRLSAHWSSFITATDFQQIKAAGLNHVRIPIGHWAIVPDDSEPYVQGQLEYLDKAVSWARDAGLKVMVDLHGAPGSQNGFDNSGRRGSIDWSRYQPNINRTLDAISLLTTRYAGDADVVTAIQPLNEPMTVLGDAGVDLQALQQFYYDSYGRVREVNQDATLTLHDGFQDIAFWNGFMSTGFSKIMMDNHHYEIFLNDLIAKNTNEHIQSVCQFAWEKLASMDKWTIVGEWTGAMTDCTKYLNGRGIGARYDGTYPGSSYIGSCAGFSQGEVTALPADTQADIRRFIEAQLDSYETGSGWIFWTWTTEGSPEWDMKRLLAADVFPNPVTSRKYPGQCG